MLFLVKVKEAYKAESVYLIALENKEDAQDAGKVKAAIAKNGTTYQSRVIPPAVIESVEHIEPHRDEEKELRDRLKVIRDFKKKNAATAEKSAPAPAPKKTAKK